MEQAKPAEVFVDSSEIQSEIEAAYVLESPVKCAGCRASLSEVHVVRMLRARVNFTSTLPRRGLVIVCPDCQTIVSATIGAKLGI